MKKALLQACAVCLGATGAYAGGLDRSGQGVNILFEDGNVVQLRLGYANPDVSGEQNGVPSGNVTNSFFSPGLAYKHSFTDRLDFAIIYDEPFGADVSYPSNYPLSQNPLAGFGGRNNDVLRAEAETDAITALLRYKFDGGFSAIGGIRAQRASATVAVPAAIGYEFDSGDETDFGYVVGVAWERPEIAARVSLVYSSKITHDFSSTESFSNPLNPPSVVSVDDDTEVVTPQSVNLDFQTGVAPKTLVFGSIRWVDWPQTVLAPTQYVGITGSNLVDYADDTFTYTLGVGYQFSEQFSGAVSAGYETSTGSEVSNLGPTDGFWSIGLGGTYSFEQAKLSGGVRYTDIGDATTTTGGEFSGNSAWSVGLQLTYALN